ncbi:Fic family protein [Enterococcus timonensis]|uniref:Fic family protein n=1 Tax=Enterococcus timonensis TaxID=1852364 RepID=UPI0008D95668|nr:Fic family protein [Enterococcus timonensis]
MKFDERPYEIDETELPYQTKLDLWQTAFGLQAVDGLKPSKYMVGLAKEQAQGKKTYQEVETAIKKYYATDEMSNDTKEADIVSLRINELLSDDYFSLSPATLLAIHGHLFKDVFTNIPVGKFRDQNITKKEDVLNGETVQYASHFMIKETLKYDFDLEKEFHVENLSKTQKGEHVMDFVSNIWQIHPFREGNTRTMAVFAIKYLRSLGFELDNEVFKSHSEFFRDALILANVSAPVKTKKYLLQFTDNLLFEGKHKLSKKIMMERTAKILSEENLKNS